MVSTWLICTAGPLHGQRFVVLESGLTMGRAEDNGIVINDEGVSRYHVRLIWRNGTLWVNDTGSRNGTFVNDVRVSGPIALKVGDSISVSTYAFAVKTFDEALSNQVTAERAAERVAPPPAKPRKPWYWPF